ncbi:hypothetical protein E2C01_044133 [Portunus trituberculatus]|uniref:Uncharacterized protein n=1 Tax=Portunus trituberculatus TaxID=210409 RepID=A0A5B7FYK2_PORTR|nr:hypothetical protein [Portunus trituberculatus]
MYLSSCVPLPLHPPGLNHLVKQSLFVCAVCPKKVSQTAHEALEHCKSREHYDCYQAHLKALEVSWGGED